MKVAQLKSIAKSRENDYADEMASFNDKIGKLEEKNGELLDEKQNLEREVNAKKEPLCNQ